MSNAVLKQVEKATKDIDAENLKVWQFFKKAKRISKCYLILISDMA